MTTTSHIPLKLICAGDNDRTQFDPVSIENLARSIAQDGLVQPITVRPKWRCSNDDCRLPLHPGQQICPACGSSDPLTFEICAGERRYRAHQFLNRATIEAMIKELNDEEASAIMLIENAHRSDLNPMDKAHAYQKRIEQFGWTVSEFSRRAKINASEVTASLKLLRLVPEAQQLIQTGQLTAKFGEIMADLDVNRQRIALQYFAQTDKPSVKEFKGVAGKLMLEQAQDSLFDASQFMAQAIEQVAEQQSTLPARYAAEQRLPIMRRHGSVAKTFEKYIEELQAGDEVQRAAIPIVARLYESMIKCGWATPNTESTTTR